MTSEPGAGMEMDVLRERLARVIANCDGWGECTDAILAEIAAAGYELVERERLERLRNLCRATEELAMLSDDVLAALDALQPGDLMDPEGTG